MKIQLLNGGLANQAFQYVFARYGELNGSDKEEWFFDDSEYFVSDIHNGYELDKVFGIKANLLSNHYSKAEWKELIENKKKGISIPQALLNEGRNVKFYSETDDYNEINPFTGKVYRLIGEGKKFPYDETDGGDISYYHGNWIDRSFFDNYKEIFLKEFHFPELTYPQALSYVEMMEKETVIGLHIRRGDYIEKGLILDTEYYRKAIEEISEKYSDYTLFVFSDDLYWCNEHSNELGLHYAPKIMYVSGNYGAGSYVDLQLMTKCKGLIIANSAFSYLGAIMNPNLETLIEPPKPKKDLYNYTR